MDCAVSSMYRDRVKRAEAETVRGSLFIHKPHFPSRPEIGFEGQLCCTMPRQDKCDAPPMAARTRPFRLSGAMSTMPIMIPAAIVPSAAHTSWGTVKYRNAKMQTHLSEAVPV